jgi:hypothetical protein
VELKLGIMDKLAFWKKEDPLPLNNAPDTFRFDEPQDERESLGPNMDMHNPFLDNEQDEQVESFKPNEPRFDSNKPFKVQNVQQSIVPQVANYDTGIASKNIEIISAKLDTLKSELEVMNQRLINIEALAKREQQNSSGMPNYKRYQQW